METTTWNLCDMREPVDNAPMGGEIIVCRDGNDNAVTAGIRLHEQHWYGPQNKTQQSP